MEHAQASAYSGKQNISKISSVLILIMTVSELLGVASKVEVTVLSIIHSFTVE